MTDSVEQPARPRIRRRTWLLVGVVVVLVALASPLMVSLLSVERIGVDQDSARERLAAREPVVIVQTPAAGPTPEPAPRVTAREEDFRSFLLVGSDERAGLAGSRADAIVVGLLPADGSAPIMFSLPRDLWLPDPCRGGHQRINAAYNGCGEDANGFELLSIVVEDFTGIAIDDVVAVDFDGFTRIIDAVGGVQVCVEHAVRDSHDLALPAGCSTADGEQALAWVRSRRTQERVDGRWRTMPGVNDLARNERQQQLMLQLLGRVASFDTVTNLYGFAQGLSDTVTLGSGLSVLDGTRLAWSLRGRGDEIRRFTIPVVDRVTSGGAQVLEPVEPFATTFDRELGRPLGAVVGE